MSLLESVQNFRKNWVAKASAAGLAGLLTLAPAPTLANGYNANAASVQPVSASVQSIPSTTTGPSQLVWDKGKELFWYQQGDEGSLDAAVARTSRASGAIFVVASAAPDNIGIFIDSAKGVASWLGRYPGIEEEIYVVAADRGKAGTGGFMVYRDGTLFGVDDDSSLSSDEMFEHLLDLGEWAAKPITVAGRQTGGNEYALNR